VHDDIERILLGEQEIRAGIERVAAAVTRAYAGEEPTVVAVLNGSVVFVADLIRALPIPLRLAFVWAESYRQGTTGTGLRLESRPSEADIRGRHVLLVDDILDSGRTLSALVAELRARGARGVRTSVFLDKPARRTVSIEADHVGFTIADEFVVGYGLDYAGRYRNLPYVGVLKPHVFHARRNDGGPRERAEVPR
jgi:hypoxanthine phosphoribosyltransferase